MNSGNVILIVGLTILGLSAYNFFVTFSNSPAFDESARIDGLYGDWRVGIGSALYDRPAYLYRLGREYINADTTVSGVTEARDELASIETALERAETAITLFQESLSLDPANAHAWTALAWAYSMTGDFVLARAAMRASWKLAPYNRSLSTSRLTFVEMLTGPMREQLNSPINVQELAYVRQDIEVAKRYKKAELDIILSYSETLKKISAE